MHHRKTKIIVLALAVGLISSGPFIAREFAKNFIIHGVQLSRLELGGLDYDDANDTVRSYYDNFLNQPVYLNFQERKIATTLEELGVKFDSYRTTEMAFELSYGENTWSHLARRAKSLVIPTQLEPVFKVDEKTLAGKIRSLIPEIRDPQEAGVQIGPKGKATVSKHQDGLLADYESAQNQIELAVSTLSLPNIEIKSEPATAGYTENEANEDALIWAGLLEREISLNYESEGQAVYTKTMRIQPEWFSVKRKTVRFHKEEIAKYLQENIAPEIAIAAENAVISALPSEGQKIATVEGLTKNGRSLDVETSTADLIRNLNGNETASALTVENLQGKVINETGEDLGKLELIAQGRSNFQGSPTGRAFNINKGLNEKINNILLLPGEEFAFNSYLGTITNSQGWQNSLAIFGGRNLRPVPGGGLCQVATTVYRAALKAGLKINEQYNHSLYVHYYRDYGDGLDSTIFPGQKDLRFVNDTASPILIQAYAEGNDAFVNFYGSPDGRKVSMAGPFYSDRIASEYREKVGKLRRNEIAWYYQVSNLPNTEEENKAEVLVSRYNNVPY